jgi:NAD(P)-dependent dehydrogenase (short-subunit alcohol dehydrogenase family)
MKDLGNKSVLLTGAASGIGRATAIAFAREGSNPLILNDINAEGLEKTAGEINGLGCTALTFPADVTDPVAVKEMVDNTIERVGRIDVLVNVAGTGVMCPFEKLDLKDWKFTIDVDLWGVIHTVHAVFPHMAERRSGHIVNISSISGLWPDMMYIAPYITAKFGVVGLSEALLVEGSLYGIDVTCICPGIVRTPVWETAQIKGFREDIRDVARYLSRLGENAEDTARSIINAVKKNKFLVVTTNFAKYDYFTRKHFSSIVTRLDRVWPRWVDKAASRYRI